MGANYPWLPDTMRILQRFPRYAERGWQVVGAPEEKLGYFGGPGHTELAMRPLAQFILVMALLATDPGYDPKPSGVSVELVRERALGAWRYMLRTHVTGDLRRPNGEAWGDDPQAPWWIGRLAMAGRLLDASLAEADRAALKRVVTHEASRQLARPPTQGAAPESVASANAWGAELLAWASVIDPTNAAAARWEEHARTLLMNSFSLPQDWVDGAEVDGKPVRNWVATTTLLQEFLATRNGAPHFCYLALPLQSFAAAYAAYAGAQRLVPRALFHHLEDAWAATSRQYLADGRFAYPAGKEWPRDAYGPSFILPFLVLLQVAGSEPGGARLLERAFIARLEREQETNADGTFYGARFSGGATVGRAAQFETDTFAMLALVHILHRMQPKIQSPASEESLQDALAGAWISPVGEVIVARSPEAYASFSWRGVGERGGPRGAFVPAGCAEMAEWGADQLIGSFDLEGFDRSRSITHRERIVPGGITTTGRIDEGQKEGRPGILHHIAFAALPSERFAVVFDLSIAAQEVKVTRNEGLQLSVVNDLFNGNERKIYSELGEQKVAGVEAKPASEVQTIASPWLNVDQRLGVVAAYGQEPFTLRNFTTREQRPTDPFRSLLAEVIETPFRAQPTTYRPRQVLRDTICLLIAGDAEATRRASTRVAVAPTGEEMVRALWYTTPDDRRFLITANFTQREQTFRARTPDGKISWDVRVPPLDTLVVRR